MRLLARCALLVVLVLGLFGSVAIPQFASAQAQKGLSQAKKLEAIRELMEKGQGLYVTGNYAGAAQIFEDGYKTYPYSAFLFNAGICYQKLKDFERALGKFNEYAKVDPNAPDLEKVKQRIASLEAQKGVPPAAPPVDDAGTQSDGGVPEAGAPPVPAPPPVADDQNAMRSLVVIETEPDGAPLTLYARVDDAAQPFKSGAANEGWKQVSSATSPASLTLAVGKYQIVVEKFRDFNVSQAEIDVAPGHVHQFKANLSQGEFMAFLRVSANVRDAHLWLDDEKKARPEWGTTPHGELISAGTHSVRIEAPGFEPLIAPFELKHGEQKEVEVKLVRVGFGYLRIDSNAPQIKVRIDEQPKGVWKSGEVPLDVQVPVGKHRLTVVADGRKDFDGMIDIPAGQVLPLHVKMIPRQPRGGAWTQAILGAAFVGASVYFGSESNKLFDQLEADRKGGALEADDSRAAQGRWYAVGADAGFAVGGVLAVLATYNFIKDPMPESSLTSDKPSEFDDPLKARPTAELAPRRLRPESVADRGRRPEGSRLELGPAVGQNGGGLFIGGRF